MLPVLSQAKLKALDTQCKSNLHQWAIAWTSYVEDNNNSFSTGTTVLWARGEWLVALDNYYGKKPDLLFCPRATLRRGPGSKETPVPVNSPNAVDWGGPTTCWASPLPDPANPHLPIISSYGMNLWVFNPPANVSNIQGLPPGIGENSMCPSLPTPLCFWTPCGAAAAPITPTSLPPSTGNGLAPGPRCIILPSPGTTRE